VSCDAPAESPPLKPAKIMLTESMELIVSINALLTFGI
jgi:hypothetical protein